MKDAAFKLIIFGEGGVGKTSLTRRYLFNSFEIGTKMTIGVDFYLKDLTIEGLKCTLQIWDFAGEDRFRALIPNYVAGASGGIFMYDTTRYSSIVHLDDWMQIIKREINKESKEIPLMMVGGKADLKDDRDIKREEAIKLAESYEFFGFSECSAKSGTNVLEVFNQITRKMLKVNKFI